MAFPGEEGEGVRPEPRQVACQEEGEEAGPHPEPPWVAFPGEEGEDARRGPQQEACREEEAAAGARHGSS